MRGKRRIFAVVMLLLCLISSSAGYAKKSKEPNPDYVGAYHSEVEALKKHIVFLNHGAKDVIQLKNGLLFAFNRPILKESTDYNVYKKKLDIVLIYPILEYDYYDYVMAIGMNITLKNTSKKALTIRWSESSLSDINYSGLPFFNGMYYQDANVPVATPDTLLVPGQIVTMNIFTSNAIKTESITAPIFRKKAVSDTICS